MIMTETENFVPLMKRSKGFKELKSLVIDEGICSGCSTCAAFCERIQLDEDGNAEPKSDCNMEIGAIKCNIEGTCYDVCPMVSFSNIEMDKAVFDKPREDMDIGYYKKIVAVRSKKPEILENAQDGGAATAFLAAALEGGLIDGVVVANRSGDWRTDAGIARTKEEIIAGAGTKYVRTPSAMKFGNTIRDIRKLAMVGTGCQTTGTRKAMVKLLKTVIEKTQESDTPLDLTLIGLFCFENFPYMRVKEKIESEFGTKMEDIVKTDITKGKFTITKKDGTTQQKPVKDFSDIVPESCDLCTNFTAEMADISIGSVGTDTGWSTVVIRSDKGLTLLENAEKLGYIEVSDKVDMKPIKKGVSLKKGKREKAAEKRKKEGKYVPEYS